MKIRPLPPEAEEAFKKLDAPARLVKHHEVVHEAACRLVEGLLNKYPETVFFNGKTVAFGAAIHDIGKIDHPEEMDGPGEKHERSGPDVMLRAGLDHSHYFSRLYQYVHADAATEVLMVALADNVWKGRRDETLEEWMSFRIAKNTLKMPWEVFSSLDRILAGIAKDSDQFLEYCRE